MRQLKISKQANGDEATFSQTEALRVSSVTEAEHMTRYIISIARQYQNQGLSQARLVEVGEAAWQWVKLHYTQDTLSLDRWGAWWIRQGIIQALNMETNDCPAAS